MRIATTKAADIALVLDQSASMYTPVGWTEDRASMSDVPAIRTQLENYAIKDFVTKANENNEELLANAKHLGYYIAVHNSENYIYIVQYAQNSEKQWGWYYIPVDSTVRSVQVDTENTTNNSDDALAQEFGTVIYGDAQILTNVTYYQSQYGALYDSVKKFVADLREQALENNVEHKVAIVGFASPCYDGWDGYDGTGIYIDKDYYLYDDDFLYKGSYDADSNTYTYKGNEGYLESGWIGDTILDPDTFIEATKTAEKLDESELNRLFITDSVYKNALTDVSTEAGYNSLLNSIEAVQANYQQTCPAAGIQIAQSIFAGHDITQESDTTSEDTDREKIIILFTDGVPTVRVDSNRQHGWTDEVQTKAKYWSITGGIENALEIAENAKVEDDVTIYTIGTSAMQGASIDNANVNSKTFLEKLSSNYTGVTVTSSYTNSDTTYVIQVSEGKANEKQIYAQFASQESGLDVAFESILTSVTTPSVDLDEDAVLREVLTDPFVLQNNQVSDITVWKAPYDGNGNFGEPVQLTDATVTLSSSSGAGTITNADGSTSVRYDTIEVTGYDYHEEYISNTARTITVNGETVDYYGSKLIVKVAIEARDGFWGGNNIPTNKGNTAIYKDEELIEKFPVPQVNVPRSPEIVTDDRVIYYGGDVESEELIEKVVIDGVEVTVNSDGTFTPAEDWMDDYADLSWSEDSTKPDSSIDNTDSKDYTYTIVLTPTGDGKTNTSENPSNIAGDPAGTQTDSDTSSVKVLVPIVTFEDSTIELGEIPDESYYDANDIIKENGNVVITWVEKESGEEMEADDPATEPELTFTYTPENSDFQEDTKVNVTVTSENDDADNNISIMDVITFDWEECEEELHQHDGQDIEKHTGNSDSHEFWIHVIPRRAEEDVVVIDFGLPVDVSVLANDTFKNPELVAVDANNTAPSNLTKEANYTAESVSDEYGTASIIHSTEGNKADVLRYELDSMEMDSHEVITYAAKSGEYYYYSTLTVIPATTIYFEDEFVAYEVYKKGDSGWEKSDESWSFVEKEETITQAEDHPGRINTSGLDANNIYGYDEAYTEMSQYSMDSVHKINVEAGKYGTATFTFWGTGFDVVSLTSNTSGTILVDVFAADTYSTDASPLSSYMVDTYYGYAYGDSDGDGDNEWYVDENAKSALYQVPVMKVTDMAYGHYTVVITASYSEFFDHKQYKDEDGNSAQNYDFYLDAIRIYDPANDGKRVDGTTNTTIREAYEADGEGWPEYYELRNLLIDANTFDSLNQEDSVAGIIFIDGNKELSNDNASAGDADAEEDTVKENILSGKSYAVSDYANYGPNNELYLAQGQAVSFKLNMEGEIAQIHLAYKSVGGTAKARIYAIVEDGSLISVKGESVTSISEEEVSTAADLYYDISALNNKTVVIMNAGASDNDAILSITNIKVTYANEPSTTQTADTFSVNRFSVEQAIGSLTEDEENESLFEPEKLEVSVDNSSVKVGSKVTVTVKTSDDVESITVNGETVSSYKTNKKTGERTWTVKLSAEAEGKMTINVVAYDSEGTASDAVEEVVTVTAKKAESNNKHNNNQNDKHNNKHDNKSNNNNKQNGFGSWK